MIFSEKVYTKLGSFRLFSGYARMSAPTAGIARIKALPIHQNVRESPRSLPLTAMIAAARPDRTLAKAIINASNPRVRQPSTSTGVAATAKKRSGAIEGNVMWRWMRVMIDFHKRVRRSYIITFTCSTSIPRPLSPNG